MPCFWLKKFLSLCLKLYQCDLSRLLWYDHHCVIDMQRLIQMALRHLENLFLKWSVDAKWSEDVKFYQFCLLWYSDNGIQVQTLRNVLTDLNLTGFSEHFSCIEMCIFRNTHEKMKDHEFIQTTITPALCLLLSANIN